MDNENIYLNNYKQKKIFVVDDEEDIIEMVKFMLESEGYETLTANNGREAMNILDQLNSNDLPDLILLDIVMKSTSGWDVLKKIKKAKKLNDIPVSMMTLIPLSEKIFKNENVEYIDSYILKPFTKDELIFNIDSIFNNNKNYMENVNNIQIQMGKQFAEKYRTLGEKISRHQHLFETLEKSYDLYDRKLISYESIIKSESQKISDLNEEMMKIENKLNINNKQPQNP